MLVTDGAALEKRFNVGAELLVVVAVGAKENIDVDVAGFAAVKPNEDDAGAVFDEGNKLGPPNNENDE